MPVEKCADAEPIRGYRLIERLGTGGFGEVWKCEAPGGIFKAVKFVYGSLNGLSNDCANAREELRAVQLIKSIRHPFLLSIDRVEVVNGELVIVTELADCNLHNLWEKNVAQGKGGLPRDELLGYLQEAAEVLDVLNHKFDLQHLDVKPRNLFLVSNHVKVADFGLVNKVSDAVTGRINADMNAVTPLYAAPELFLGNVSRHSDQYSLAIAYQELLTGSLPFAGKNTRQLLLQHTQEEPDLQSLPPHDRVIVGRALAKNPEHRFANCMDFVRALKAEMAAAPVASTSDSEVNLGGPQHGVDTLNARFGEATPTPKPEARPVLPDGVLANYRFAECLGNSPLMETWKAQSPDGAKKRVMVLYGLGTPDVTKLKDALARLATIQHPALNSADVLHMEPGRLVLGTEHYRTSMRDRAHECQSRKQPGIPRAELIDYVRAAAEVLDYLYLQHSVQHLNLNPRNLVLDNGWLQIAEFGFAQILWLPAKQDIVQRNMRYAAPELLSEELSRHCDQYSLALLYAEMLTGVHPFRGLGPRAYLAKKMTPDLERLPDLDRDVIRKALDPDPDNRWTSCTEMVLALEGTSPELSQEMLQKSDSFAKFIEDGRLLASKASYTGVEPGNVHAVIADLINAIGGHAEPLATATPEVSKTGDAVHYQFLAGIPLGAAQEQLQAFSKQLFTRIERRGDTTSVMYFDLPSTFWQQWRSQVPRLELQVDLARVNMMSATPIEVKATLYARHCSKQRAAELFARMSVDIFNTLQQHMLLHSEKRARDRMTYSHPLRIIPISAEGQPEEAIECRGKDLSQSGMGFYLPHDLSTSEVLIELPNPQSAQPVKVHATLVRAKRCADGWYDVGALFRLPSQLRSEASAEAVV